MEVTHDSRDKDIITSGFIRRKVRFRRPTPPSSSSRGDSSNLKIIIFPKFVSPPLLWDMEEMYGAAKRPH
jgi:hypothetical protein